MSNYITIDGGTTNTRIALLSDKRVLDTVKLNIGARAAMGNREMLFSEIEKGIMQLTEKYPDVKPERIIAAGMLTSEFGLLEVEHISLPAGIAELNKNLKNTEMFGYPITFIPGVKSVSEDFLKNDMMRGEETELIGIMSSLPREAFLDAVVVLPGSHSKFIYTDEDMRITSITSLLTGEMLAALSQNTILKDAVSFDTDGYSSEYLLKGYYTSASEGINASLLRVRILKNLFGADKKATYSFFLGIVLQPEIESLIKSKAEKVVLAGKRQIKEPMAELLNKLSDKTVAVVDDETVQNSVFAGMISIYEYSKEAM